MSRKNILIILFAAAVISAAIVSGFFIRPSPIVLMYHSVSDEPIGDDAVLSVTVAEFRSQMSYIASHRLKTGFTGEDCDICITFDDGYTDNYANAFPILSEYGLRATVFVSVSLIGSEGYMSMDELRELSDSGVVSVQSHGYLHSRLDLMSDTEALNELTSSRAAIESITGRECYALSYPEGGYDDDVKALAFDAGYRLAFTTETPNIYRAFDEFAIPRSGVPRGLEEKDYCLLSSRINWFELFN